MKRFGRLAALGLALFNSEPTVQTELSLKNVVANCEANSEIPKEKNN